MSMNVDEQRDLRPIGRRMAAARSLAGVSAAEMADRIGISKNMISRWENGHDDPRTMVTMAYAYVCGVDHDEWFERLDSLPTCREVVMAA